MCELTEEQFLELDALLKKKEHGTLHLVKPPAMSYEEAKQYIIENIDID